MPRGPQGQKRPADVVGCAVTVAKIATGEVEETPPLSGRVRSGVAGHEARMESTSPERRKEIAQKAAQVRWSKDR